MATATVTSIISGIRTYIATCPALQIFSAKNRHIDFSDDSCDSYGIIPDGEKVLRKFITGGGKMQYNFTLYVNRLSKDDAQRLANAELLESVKTWLDTQRAANNLPQLPTGCTPTKITAENAMLLETGSRTNTYQMQFILIYTKS